MSKSKKVAIRVGSDTRDKLKTMGTLGETYDDVIRQLIIDREDDAARAEHEMTTLHLRKGRPTA